MSVNIQQLSIEQLAAEVENLKAQRVYELHYKYGFQKPRSKYFRFSGNMLDAKQHAQRHCIDMGYTYIWCNPLVVDLDEQFAAKKRGEFDDNQIR